MDKKVGKKEILLLVIIFVAAVIGYFCVSENAKYTRRTGQSNGRRKRVRHL